MKTTIRFFALVLFILLVNSLAFAQDTTLTVTSDGNVGIGTTTPSQKLHVVGSIRSQAIGSSNRAGLFAGSDGAARLNSYDDETSQYKTLYIDGNPVIFRKGNVGIGQPNPGSYGHLEVAGAGYQAISVQSTDGSGVLGIMAANSSNELRLGVVSSHKVDIRTDNIARLTVMPITGNVGIGTTNPTHPLEMASGAHVTTGGVWTDASSRALKENIRDLTGDEAARALSQLAPKRYNYKAEKSEEYLGFIAEDVPELVATGNRKSLSPMDIVAVLTRVAQEQQKTILQLKNEVKSLKHQIQK